MATKPFSLAKETTDSASFQLSAKGISTCTCLPAFKQAMLWAACICVGVHKITASTSGNAKLSSNFVVTCWMPYLLATSLVFSNSRLIRETTSTPSICLMPSKCLMPKAPAPASATFIVLDMWWFSEIKKLLTFQNSMANRSVRCRHVVETFDEFGRFASNFATAHIRHRSACNQPHHQLNSFATGFAHIVNVR